MFYCGSVCEREKEKTLLLLSLKSVQCMKSFIKNGVLGNEMRIKNEHMSNAHIVIHARICWHVDSDRHVKVSKIAIRLNLWKVVSFNDGFEGLLGKGRERRESIESFWKMVVKSSELISYALSYLSIISRCIHQLNNSEACARDETKRKGRQEMKRTVVFAYMYWGYCVIAKVHGAR